MKDEIKVSRRGRMGGCEVYIDQLTLAAAGIPEDTPIDHIKVKRYQTNKNVILVFKHAEGKL